MPFHWIALGGALGAVARAGVGAVMAARFGTALPWATLSVNVVGCALIGLAMPWLALRPEQTEHLRAGLVVGFLGAFTTFSAFGYETLHLVEQGHPDRALLNVVGNVVVCLLAVWGGLQLGRALVSG